MCICMTTVVERRATLGLTVCMGCWRGGAAAEQNQAVRYLQFCVQTLKNEDQAVHNLLLSLYVRQTDDTPLLQFLRADVWASAWALPGRRRPPH